VGEQWIESLITVSSKAGVGPAREQQAEEEKLLRRIAASDGGALEELYRLYSGRVLAFLRQLCRDAEIAEDLVQEVFLAVWRKASTFDPARGDVAGWVFTICRHKWIDSRRRRQPTAELDAMEYDPPAPEESRDLRILLDKAMLALSGAERDALRLAYFGGFTYEETALHLGLPLGTLKSRIRVALRKISFEIRESPDDQRFTA
jgi:RNA polymerase sigma-70 factor (ECF subfamily)